MNKPENEKNEAVRLQDVLDEYALEEPSPERLQEWVDRFPQFKEELVAFTVREAIFDWIAEADDEDDDDGDSSADMTDLVRYGMDRLDQLLQEPPPAEDDCTEASTLSEGPAEQEQAGDAPTLLVLLQQAGYDPEEVMKAVGLSFILLGKLNRGMITFPSDEIQRAVARAIAQATGLALMLVMRSMHQKARLVRGAHFARERPEARTQDFFDAIREDPLMSPEEKEHWLSLQP